jgi:hypothetical protein
LVKFFKSLTRKEILDTEAIVALSPS